MNSNKLKLNDEKTEAIVITPSHQSKKINIQPIQIGNYSIMPTHTAHNLGATFHHHMSPNPHVSSIIKSCNFQLWRLGQIRKYLSTDASEKLIHAFISSRLALLEDPRILPGL